MLHDEWLFNAIRNGTCPICKRTGLDEFSLGNNELKFCSDEHMKYYMFLWNKRMTEGLNY